MESNKKVVDESLLVERNGAEDEVSELPVEENATVESKVDEVMAKGIAAETSSVGLEDRDTIVDEGSNAENVEVGVGSLQDKAESDSIDDDEEFEEAVEAVVEDEKFEEAVEPSPEAQSAEDETGSELEVLGNKDSAVQDQNNSDQFARDETVQLEKFDSVESGKAEVMEFLDLDATSKTDTSIYLVQENEKSDVVAEKPENGVLDHLNPEETLTSDAVKTYDNENDSMTVDDGKHDEVVHEKLGMRDANEVKGGHGNPQKPAESYKDILLQSEKSIEVRETSDTTYTGFQDEVDIHNCNSAIPDTESKGEKCTDLDEKDSLLLESVDSDGENEEGKDAPPCDTSVNGHHGEILFNEGMKEKQSLVPKSLNSSENDEEQKDVQSNDDGDPDRQRVSSKLSIESKENELPDPATNHHGDSSVGNRAATLEVVSSHPSKDSMELPVLSSFNQDNKNGEQKGVQSNDTVLDHQGGSFKLPPESKENEIPEPAIKHNGDSSVGYKAVAPEANCSHPSKDSIDVETCASSSDLAVEISKHPQPQFVKSTLEIPKAVAKEPVDVKQVIYMEANQTIPLNGEEETKSVTDSSSFAVSAREDEMKSATDSSAPTASAREEETKSATDSSSSAASAREEETKSATDSSSSAASAREEETKSATDSSSSAASAREEETKSATDSSSSAAPVTRTATPTRPAGLGRAAPLLEPATRVVQPPRLNGAVSQVQNQLVEESTNAEGEENDETREKLQMIRVRFLRLAHRLGQTPHNGVVAQVLYRLGLAEQLRGRNGGGRVAAFSFDRASAMAEQLEAAGQEPLDFSCTIMVLGKTGVGKSATINSIFDEGKIDTDAFQIGTKKVQDVVGTVQGIRVRVIDTPGLLSSWSDQRQNEKILHSVKNFIKKTPPDIVLYLDRLDMQSRDYGDMPLLRTITNVFGSSIWFNAIVVLTHAASAPPEDTNGTATSYDVFVTQRSLVVQQAIRQAAGDMRLMNPVSLVENHSACRTNRAGQRVLPNGQVWKPHLLLLSFASKILAEANKLLKLQDSPPGRAFAHQAQSPPLPFLLSSFLQPRPQVKLPMEQFGEDDEALDDELDESSDSEDESEYDQLPPFKCLTKAQLAKLTKEQRKAYYDELEYREKLFMLKQLKEERRRRKTLKQRQAAAKDLPANSEESTEEDINGAASVPVPIPDMALPASFDSDNPTHRYRRLDSSNQWFVRPVLDSHGWDHDVGYEGINVERLFVVKEKLPISFSGSLSKDKKDSSLQMEIASSVNHGDGKATSLGFDMQSLGKDIAYTLRSETKFLNFRKNKATAGLSATLLGDAITGGFKVEDKFIVSKRGQVVISGGAMFGRGDVAYAGSLEATLRDKDHPLGRFLSTLGLSFMDWHGDISFGCNSQTQIPVGRHTNLIARVNINDKGSGQVSLRLASSEQLQIALICLVPVARKILGYCQQVQYT
ncbi:PREDICTED: translocase of chloroplast 120, chloroplastic-like isoform X2 [Ipomoea nil]|uniref:translocase of chloroplast 120, chloroplastic-like isoform X2 n=1 Tax=Ipomoea nil TaxID=35883 RepID=UPI0009018635|nr:PREDICTED: translocase of chloroplast 120, chloroplastic-like isoform X2 [Ipomoea nil]